MEEDSFYIGSGWIWIACAAFYLLGALAVVIPILSWESGEFAKGELIFPALGAVALCGAGILSSIACRGRD